MIIIYNKKINSEIIIDDSVDWVQFTPRNYEENPYVIIELKGLNLFQHSQKCKDCKNFINAFGKETIDWYISFSDKVFRLVTSNTGKKKHSKNEIKTIISDFENGTKITIAFHHLPADKSELELLLSKEVKQENYEKACVIRDLINQN